MAWCCGVGEYGMNRKQRAGEYGMNRKQRAGEYGMNRKQYANEGNRISKCAARI